MSTINRFRQFPVYRDCREFRKSLKLLIKQKLPPEEKFCLGNQLWRALDSVVLNIAEGADRGTDKDFAHFLNNSYTSLNEVIACLDLALDDAYITQEEHTEYLTKAAHLIDQLTAFRRKLLSNMHRQ
jgi:four helix bundle protein